jgi:hypothetical protein
MDPPQPIIGGSFTSLNVDDVRTSQQTHLWACMVCYTDSFTFNLRVTQRQGSQHGLYLPDYTL